MAQLGQTRTGPAETDTVPTRLRALSEHWPPADGVAVFHRVYLAAAESTEPHPLATRLAERYLAAVDAVRDGHRPAASWRPVFQYRRHPGVRPLQFALAGLNAHVGHDLALAVVDSCHDLGCEPADLEGAFDRVGDLLVTLEDRVREDLTPGPDRLEITDPLTHLLGTWSLERARDAAWSAARVLWGLRELPDLAAEFRERTDAGVGLVGRCLLTPWR